MQINSNTHTHIHTQRYAYIYIYIYIMGFMPFLKSICLKVNVIA